MTLKHLQAASEIQTYRTSVKGISFSIMSIISFWAFNSFCSHPYSKVGAQPIP